MIESAPIEAPPGVGRRITVTPYPPYSGPDVTCSKCGQIGASTDYRAVGRCIEGHNDHLGIGGFKPNERLCRTCSNCGYAWDEATVEDVPPGATVKVATPEQVRNDLRFELGKYP